VKQINLQDSFLNQARRENVIVKIKLLDGQTLEGRVEGFDNFTVILNNEGQRMMIYKHAIASVVPPKDALRNFPRREQEVRKEQEKGKKGKAFNDALKRELEDLKKE